MAGVGARGGGSGSPFLSPLPGPGLPSSSDQSPKAPLSANTRRRDFSQLQCLLATATC